MKVPGVREDPTFRLFDRSVQFQGKVVGVSVDHIRLPGGHETRHEVLHLPPAVCVVPLLDGGERGAEVVLVEQFRNSVEGFIHEIPAGVLERGEEPRECAARELEEETGYRAGSIRHLATLFPIPGTSSHQMHFFLAEDLEPGEQRLEAAECLSVRRASLQELARGVVSGVWAPDGAGGRSTVRIVDAKTHIGILHAACLRGVVPGAGASSGEDPPGRNP